MAEVKFYELLQVVVRINNLEEHLSNCESNGHKIQYAAESSAVAIEDFCFTIRLFNTNLLATKARDHTALFRLKP